MRPRLSTGLLRVFDYDRKGRGQPLYRIYAREKARHGDIDGAYQRAERSTIEYIVVARRCKRCKQSEPIDFDFGMI